MMMICLMLLQLFEFSSFIIVVNVILTQHEYTCKVVVFLVFKLCRSNSVYFSYYKHDSFMLTVEVTGFN